MYRPRSVERQHPDEGGNSVDTARVKWALALRATKSIGDRTFKLLVDHFGSPEEVLTAGSTGLIEALGDTRRARELAGARPDLDSAERLLESVAGIGVKVIHYGGPGYPEQLAAIYDPPAGLYVNGQIDRSDCATRGGIAIVGSRKASPHGAKCARHLARGLALEGFTIVSGLAQGIDTCSHVGALEGKGITLAVLGSGIDVIYPYRNRDLAARIVAEGGALISEHPPGTRPDARFFPRRNRIISGLSLGVVVVEATRKSGSLITASTALDQGREVFAVPGIAGSALSEGVNNLLRQGAALAEKPEDILRELGFESLAQETKGKKGKKNKPVGADADRVLLNLEKSPQHIDLISQKCGLGVLRTGAALMELVLAGRAEEWAGKRFRLSGD